jgi:hypothetical protein
VKRFPDALDAGCILGNKRCYEVVQFHYNFPGGVIPPIYRVGQTTVM